MAEELIVSDGYLEKMTSYIKEQGTHDEEMVSMYRRLIENVCENCIIQGQVHNAVEAYLPYVMELEGEMTYLSDMLAEIIQSFDTEIDEKDQYLYQS